MRVWSVKAPRFRVQGTRYRVPPLRARVRGEVQDLDQAMHPLLCDSGFGFGVWAFGVLGEG